MNKAHKVISNNLTNTYTHTHTHTCRCDPVQVPSQYDSLQLPQVKVLRNLSEPTNEPALHFKLVRVAMVIYSVLKAHELGQ